MKTKYLIPAAGILILLMTGCNQDKQIEILPRQELFSLTLGKMEDQIDLFQIEGMPFKHKNRIYTRDGMFYIVNGNSAKIMQFTSYGDLIFLLYNPFVNPEPVVLSNSNEETLVTTMLAVPYELREAGEIAIDKNNNIYVEDTVSNDKWIMDEKLGIILNSRVSRFNRRGELLDFFGKDGLENSLFPYIERIYLNNKNQLIVQCLIPTARMIYWFTETGKLLHTDSISELVEGNIVPEKKNTITIVDKIIPAMDSEYLFVKITFSYDIIDKATNSRENIKELYSRVYRYNMNTGEYEGYITVPPPGKRKYYTDAGEVEIPAPSFEFLGIALDQYYFFIRPAEDARYELLIVNSQGNIYKKQFIIIEDTQLFAKELNLSATGLLYGLLSHQSGVDIVLWRSDRLLGEKHENP